MLSSAGPGSHEFITKYWPEFRVGLGPLMPRLKIEFGFLKDVIWEYVWAELSYQFLNVVREKSAFGGVSLTASNAGGLHCLLRHRCLIVRIWRGGGG